jgi:hypothetical protein
MLHALNRDSLECTPHAIDVEFDLPLSTSIVAPMVLTNDLLRMSGDRGQSPFGLGGGVSLGDSDDFFQGWSKSRDAKEKLREKLKMQ